MDLKYSIPVRVDAGDFRHLMLMQTCVEGSGTAVQGDARAATPRMVREAEHWMRTGGAEVSASTIAARVGVSLRSLEVGFREFRRSTPTQYLRKIRLEKARGELLAPSASTTVTSVALSNGFFHLGRFSAYYLTAFAETPSQTLRRGRLS